MLAVFVSSLPDYNAGELTVTKHGRVADIDRDAFEPEVIDDIQTTENSDPRIPHILHFVYITGNEKGNKKELGIPDENVKNIKSFLHFNPNWTYYFWSDESARALISERHPALISTYDSYTRPIAKTDAIRYVLMYEFGGVYVDLDTECFRPLDRATMKYACILSPEPFVHSAVLYGQNYYISTAMLLCRPKHPFYLQVIRELPNYAHFNSDFKKAAGTVFFTKQFGLYNKIAPHGDVIFDHRVNDNTPYFYQVKLEAAESDKATYVVNSKYFMGTFDLGKKANSKFQIFCIIYSFWYDIVRRGCKLWRQTKTVHVRNPYTYTDHLWAHTDSKDKNFKMVPIQSLIPQVKLYKSHR